MRTTAVQERGTFNLAGGRGELSGFFDHLGLAFESLWDDAHRPQVTDALKADLVKGAANALAPDSLEVVLAQRDAKLRNVFAAAGAPPLP